MVVTPNAHITGTFNATDSPHLVTANGRIDVAATLYHDGARHASTNATMITTNRGISARTSLLSSAPARTGGSFALTLARLSVERPMRGVAVYARLSASEPESESESEASSTSTSTGALSETLLELPGRGGKGGGRRWVLELLGDGSAEERVGWSGGGMSPPSPSVYIS